MSPRTRGHLLCLIGMPAFVIGTLGAMRGIDLQGLWSTVGAFVVLAGLAAAVGVLVAPMLGLPRVLLAKYELRKVRLVTHRIDAAIRERACGALSHPDEDEGKGNVSLPASRS